jgi:hypothetical protein
MPKVTVFDLVVREREVDVPAKCPKCEADLTLPDALKVWEFQDQCRPAHFGEVWQGEGLNWDDSLPDAGENYMPVDFYCKKCDHLLATGEELTITGEDETRGFEVLIGAVKRVRKAAS